MRVLLVSLPLVFATYMPFCTPPVKVTPNPPGRAAASLWEDPVDLATRDLYAGPWGMSHAPDPDGRFTFVEAKHRGINPGMTVRDERKREWSVKQALPDGQTAEGPVEVTLSRLLWAVGFHQPPVYYLPAFTLEDDWGTRRAPGGRFRLKLEALKDRGEWSWQQNPFVGTPAYQGLLAMLLLFNSSDLKNANNTLYEYRGGGHPVRWYTVRDLGSALGGTGRLAPVKGDPDRLGRDPYLRGVRGGFVEFQYRGWHQELVRDRITPADVGWACALLARLSDRQWADAFRAGGFAPDVSAIYIRVLRARVQEGLEIAAPRPAALFNRW